MGIMQPPSAGNLDVIYEDSQMQWQFRSCRSRRRQYDHLLWPRREYVELNTNFTLLNILTLS